MSTECQSTWLFESKLPRAFNPKGHFVALVAVELEVVIQDQPFQKLF